MPAVVQLAKARDVWVLPCNWLQGWRIGWRRVWNGLGGYVLRCVPLLLRCAVAGCRRRSWCCWVGGAVAPGWRGAWLLVFGCDVPAWCCADVCIARLHCVFLVSGPCLGALSGGPWVWIGVKHGVCVVYPGIRWSVFVGSVVIVIYGVYGLSVSGFASALESLAQPQDHDGQLQARMWARQHVRCVSDVACL